LPYHEVIEGSVDDLKRPLIRLELPGFSDPLVAFIDTGFNGSMIVDEAQAGKAGISGFDGWPRQREVGQPTPRGLLVGLGHVLVVR
jgi:hypothetical protein